MEKITSSHEEKVQRLQRLIAESKKINSWRERTLHSVLTTLAPRIDKLNNQCYMGCGFHYNLVQTLGKIISELAISFEPTMNWLEKNEEEEITWMIIKVKTNGLFKQVAKAEASIKS